MILYYKFKVVREVVDEERISYSSIDTPLIEKEVEEDFDYQVEPDVYDLLDYLGVHKSSDTCLVGEKILQVFGGLLEEDKDFYEFMHQRYEEQARKECEQEE